MQVLWFDQVRCISFVFVSGNVYDKWKTQNHKGKLYLNQRWHWTKQKQEIKRGTDYMSALLHFCTSAIMLYPRCMTYPGHFLTIHARHLDCLARFAGYHVFTLVSQIVTPVKCRLYLTFSFVLALQGFNILYM